MSAAPKFEIVSHEDFVVRRQARASENAGRRRLRAERTQRRVVTPILATTARIDPLDHGGGSLPKRLASLATYGLLALGLQGLLVAGSVVIGTLGGPEDMVDNRDASFTLMDTPVAEIDPETPDGDPAGAQEAPEPESEPEPDAPEMEPPADPVNEPTPADPVDQSPSPPAEPAPKRRRIVGLSFDSTTGGGTGPSFAVGNTRMGRTADKAENPTEVEELAPSTPGTTNRAASRIPMKGVKRTKPKPVGPPIEPEYPATLKAQGITGVVVLFITISEEGKVTKAEVIKPSPYPEFNEAAVAAALRGSYDPATANDKPVPYSTKSTVLFDLSET